MLLLVFVLAFALLCHQVGWENSARIPSRRCKIQISQMWALDQWWVGTLAGHFQPLHERSARLCGSDVCRNAAGDLEASRWPFTDVLPWQWKPVWWTAEFGAWDLKVVPPPVLHMPTNHVLILDSLSVFFRPSLFLLLDYFKKRRSDKTQELEPLSYIKHNKVAVKFLQHQISVGMNPTTVFIIKTFF